MWLWILALCCCIGPPGYLHVAGIHSLPLEGCMCSCIYRALKCMCSCIYRALKCMCSCMYRALKCMCSCMYRANRHRFYLCRHSGVRYSGVYKTQEVRHSGVRLSFVLTQTQWGKMGPLSKCIARQQLVAHYDVASLTGEPAHSLVGGTRTVRRRCD